MSRLTRSLSRFGLGIGLSCLFINSAAFALFLPNLSQVNLAEISVGRGGELKLELKLDLAEGLHLNEKAPSKATAGIIAETKGQEQTVTIKGGSTIIPVKLPDTGDSTTVQLDTTVYYCRSDGKGLCYIKSYSFTQPVRLDDGNKEASVELKAKLEIP